MKLEERIRDLIALLKETKRERDYFEAELEKLRTRIDTEKSSKKIKLLREENQALVQDRELVRLKLKEMLFKLEPMNR